MTVGRWLGTLGWVCIFLLPGPRDSGSANASPPSTLVYVANEHSSTVSIIRSSDNRVISTIAVEGSPLSIGIMPDISKLYVGVAKRGISVIRTSDRQIETTLKVGDHPVALAITPDGSKLYSLNIKDQQAIFSVIETRQDRIVDSFPIELQCSI